MDLEEAYGRLLAAPGVVVLLGGIETGKTTFGIELARRSAAAGVATAIVDADIGQSVVGPPTTVGLKMIRSDEDVTSESLRVTDAIGFVGTISPRGYLLPLVANTAK